MLIFGTIRADSLRYMIHHVAGHVTCYVHNVLGKRAGQASEPVKISPTLPSTINYRSNIGDIETKQLVLQTTELNIMSNFTTLATLW
jgi:hypothetical protein